MHLFLSEFAEHPAAAIYWPDAHMTVKERMWSFWIVPGTLDPRW
jgi:hypothetical protein